MGIRESLIVRRDKIGLELEAVVNTDRHITYKQGLYAELEAIKELLEDPTLDLEDSADIGEPFEIETQGLS